MSEEPRKSPLLLARRAIGSTRRRDVLVTILLLGAIASLHLLSEMSPQAATMHLLFRKLYYVPIMYAGFAFGWRGGFAVAVASVLLLAPHAQTSSGVLVGENVDNLYEMAMYLTIGLLFGWLRDLEERKAGDLRQVSLRLEQAYHTLEERAIQLTNIQEYTEAILRSITAGVITVSPEGSVATVNVAAERMLGMREEDMVPRKIGLLFSHDGGLDAALMRFLNGQSPKMVSDLKAVTIDGRTLHLEVAMARMRDVGGRALGAVVTLEDVSEVRALTDQLIRADRLAAMGELTAGVAHEVRNPLGIIRASVQLVEDSNGDQSRVRDATRIIKQEIDRLDRVIKALLDFGRPSAPTLRQTNVEDVVDDVVLFTRQFAVQAHVDIDTEFAAADPLVLADADQLKQVLVNLVSNAVQAMEDTGGNIVVRVWDDDSFVFVSVADDGPGIDAEALEKVFDPFYSTRGGGTGLGLTIVHRIIDQHGGRVEVQSEPGVGTTFTIALPATSRGRGDR